MRLNLLVIIIIINDFLIILVEFVFIRFLQLLVKKPLQKKCEEGKYNYLIEMAKFHVHVSKKLSYLKREVKPKNISKKNKSKF